MNGASGQPVVLTVRCGGAGSAPNPHLALGARTAKGWTSSLSTAPASSAHRVSAPPTCCKPNFQLTAQLFLFTATLLYSAVVVLYLLTLTTLSSNLRFKKKSIKVLKTPECCGRSSAKIEIQHNQG